ncbi:signal peptidase II [Candidatus Gracilibacteria bacterium]|nr:signal peptidase II [Candidatus Gracilibacteria bacterium]
MVAIGIDMITKYFAEIFLSGEKVVYVFADFIQLKLSYNTGIAFSFPIEGIPLQIITVVLIGAIVYQYLTIEYNKKSKLLDIAYVLILSGAISHAYERIFIGHVIDFIAVKYFAILNFADIFISVGVFFLFVYYVRYERSGKS